jgi:hypothetical protein
VDNFFPLGPQKRQKRGYIQGVAHRRIGREVLICQVEQPGGGRQTPAMLGMRRVLEIFLQMDESTGRLYQAFKKNRIVRAGFQPKLLQDVVSFVVMLFIPTLKEGPVKWVLLDSGTSRPSICAHQLGH